MMDEVSTRRGELPATLAALIYLDGKRESALFVHWVQHRAVFRTRAPVAPDSDIQLVFPKPPTIGAVVLVQGRVLSSSELADGVLEIEIDVTRIRAADGSNVQQRFLALMVSRTWDARPEALELSIPEVREDSQEEQERSAVGGIIEDGLEVAVSVLRSRFTLLAIVLALGGFLVDTFVVDEGPDVSSHDGGVIKSQGNSGILDSVPDLLDRPTAGKTPTASYIGEEADPSLQNISPIPAAPGSEVDRYVFDLEKALEDAALEDADRKSEGGVSNDDADAARRETRRRLGLAVAALLGGLLAAGVSAYFIARSRTLLIFMVASGCLAAVVGLIGMLLQPEPEGSTPEQAAPFTGFVRSLGEPSIEPPPRRTAVYEAVLDDLEEARQRRASDAAEASDVAEAPDAVEAAVAPLDSEAGAFDRFVSGLGSAPPTGGNPYEAALASLRGGTEEADGNTMGDGPALPPTAAAPPQEQRTMPEEETTEAQPSQPSRQSPPADEEKASESRWTATAMPTDLQPGEQSSRSDMSFPAGLLAVFFIGFFFGHGVIAFWRWFRMD